MSAQGGVQREEPPGHPGRPGQSSRRWWLAVAVTCTVVLAGVFPSLPPGVRNWDNLVKLQVARNILQGRGPVLTERTPADDFYVLVGKDGQRYSGYMPLTYLLQLPTLAMSTMGVPAEGVSALVLLALMAGALVGWGRSAGVAIPAAMTGAMLVCLASPFWPMTAHGYDNHVDALGLISILWAGTGERKERSWLWAGLVVGASLATRLSAAVLLVPAAVLMLGQRPRSTRSVIQSAALFAAGCLPGVVLVLWFNFDRFGSPFVVHTTTSLGTMEQLTEPWFSERHWVGMAGLTVSFGKGLIWYSPVLLVALALARPVLRQYPAAVVGLACFAVVAVVFFGRLKFWHGDWGWGPRYLAPLHVVAAPLGWLLWERLVHSGRLAKVTAALAFMLLILVQAVPVVGYPVETYFGSTLRPLAAAGLLATRPITSPPVPDDHERLYFRFENSPIVRLVQDFPRLLLHRARGPQVRTLSAWAALLPAFALAAVLLVARRLKRSILADSHEAAGLEDKPAA